MKALNIQVASFDAFARQAKANARLIDAGNHTGQPAVLSFSSMELLLKVLTPNCWILLDNLSGKGQASIRALSQHLRRDYRGAHADNQVLLEQNPIEREPDRKISVSWSKVTATSA